MKASETKIDRFLTLFGCEDELSIKYANKSDGNEGE